MVFKVDLFTFWKHRVIFMILIILMLFTVAMALHFLLTGFNSKETFQHISIAQLPLFLLGLICFSCVMGLMVTLPYHYESITTLDESLVGRNSWNKKKEIPYSSIERIDRITRLAHEQIMVDGGAMGKVHISVHIENLEELISIIELRAKLLSNDDA